MIDNIGLRLVIPFGWSVVLEILTKVMIACFGHEYLMSRCKDEEERRQWAWKVWSAKHKRLEDFVLDERNLNRYRHYQIQFRVAGTSDEGYEMNIERKYSVYDMIYPYTFSEIEMTDEDDGLHSVAMDGDYLAVQPAVRGGDYLVEVRIRIKDGSVNRIKYCKLFARPDGSYRRRSFEKGELPEETLRTYATHVLENPKMDGNHDKLRQDAGELLGPVFEAIDYCCDSAWAKPYHHYEYRYTNVWMASETSTTAVDDNLAAMLETSATRNRPAVDIKTIPRSYEMAFGLLDRLLVANEVLGALRKEKKKSTR